MRAACGGPPAILARSSCGSRKGSAMGLMQRFSTIVKAKTSKLLDKAEDPRETLDYSYEKQLEMLQKVRRGVADVATSKKRLELQAAKLEQSVTEMEFRHGFLNPPNKGSWGLSETTPLVYFRSLPDGPREEPRVTGLKHEVSERLGHSTTTITQNLYTHVRRALHDKAAEAVVELLPKRSTKRAGEVG